MSTPHMNIYAIYQEFIIWNLEEANRRIFLDGPRPNRIAINAFYDIKKAKLVLKLFDS